MQLALQACARIVWEFLRLTPPVNDDVPPKLRSILNTYDAYPYGEGGTSSSKLIYFFLVPTTTSSEWIKDIIDQR